MTRRRLMTLVLSLALIVAGCGSAQDDLRPDQVATSQRAATAIEYGLIAALIAVVIIGALTDLGAALEDTFDAVADQVNDVNDAAQEQVRPSCIEICAADLETALALCSNEPCAEAAIAGHEACVAACNGRGTPWVRWPMIALQSNEDRTLSVPREDTFRRPVRFVIPGQIDVAYGGTGHGQAELSWRTHQGSEVRCIYAPDVDRYLFVACTNRQSAGGHFTAHSVRLSVSPGDPAFMVTVAAVDLLRAR